MAGCDTCWHLTIRRKNKHHVIREHYRPVKINPKKSYFYPNRLSHRELFHVSTNVPRWLMGQLGWSERQRFEYTIQFDFDVGVYPVEGNGHTPTNRVKIICACRKCPGCGIHVPTDIITMHLVG